MNESWRPKPVFLPPETPSRGSSENNVVKIADEIERDPHFAYVTAIAFLYGLDVPSLGTFITNFFKVSLAKKTLEFKPATIRGRMQDAARNEEFRDTTSPANNKLAYVNKLLKIAIPEIKEDAKLAYRARVQLALRGNPPAGYWLLDDEARSLIVGLLQMPESEAGKISGYDVQRVFEKQFKQEGKKFPDVGQTFDTMKRAGKTTNLLIEYFSSKPLTLLEEQLALGQVKAAELLKQTRFVRDQNLDKAKKARTSEAVKNPKGKAILAAMLEMGLPLVSIAKAITSGGFKISGPGLRMAVSSMKSGKNENMSDDEKRATLAQRYKSGLSEELLNEAKEEAFAIWKKYLISVTENIYYQADVYRLKNARGMLMVLLSETELSPYSIARAIETEFANDEPPLKVSPSVIEKLITKHEGSREYAATALAFISTEDNSLEEEKYRQRITEFVTKDAEATRLAVQQGWDKRKAEAEAERLRREAYEGIMKEDVFVKFIKNIESGTRSEVLYSLDKTGSIMNGLNPNGTPKMVGVLTVTLRKDSDIHSQSEKDNQLRLKQILTYLISLGGGNSNPLAETLKIANTSGLLLRGYGKAVMRFGGAIHVPLVTLGTLFLD